MRAPLDDAAAFPARVSRRRPSRVEAVRDHHRGVSFAIRGQLVLSPCSGPIERGVASSRSGCAVFQDMRASIGHAASRRLKLERPRSPTRVRSFGRRSRIVICAARAASITSSCDRVRPAVQMLS